MVAPIIPEYSNPGNVFLSAYFKSLENRRRSADLERKIEQATMMSALKEKQLAIQQSLGEQRIQNASDLIDLRRDKDDRLMTDFSGLVGQIKALKAQPGTYEYGQELNRIETDHPIAAGSIQGSRLLSPLRKENDMIFNKQQTLFDQKLKQFGIPYDAFENQQNWKKRPDGKRFIHIPSSDELANPQDYEPVGGVAPKKGKNFITIDDKTFDTLSTQYKNLMGSVPSTGLHNAKFNSDMLREAQIARERAADPNFDPDKIRAHFKGKYEVDLDDVK